MEDMPHLDDLREEAVLALARLYSGIIREGENPDHGGPEDAADILATKTVSQGIVELTSMDWRDLIS